jgi:hypothetical protein
MTKTEAQRTLIAIVEAIAETVKEVGPEGAAHSGRGAITRP